MGIDRPSPDHANAKVIFLISSHLETGHYFNPHAQRIIEAKAARRQARSCSTPGCRTPPRTPTAGWRRSPAREAAIILAIAQPPHRHTAATTASSCAAGGTGRSTWPPSTPTLEPTFEAFEAHPGRALRRVHLRVRRGRVRRRRRDARRGRRGGRRAPAPGSRPTTGARPRPATSAAGRCRARLFLLNALLGAVAHRRAARSRTPGTSSCPGRSTLPPHPDGWNELTWPLEYPLAHERAVVPAAALPQGGAGHARRLLHPRLQPGLDQPGRLLLDRGAHRRATRSACHVALTPTWSETAFFADYVLPMGHGSERHDLHSYEQYDGQWIGFRQPVLRAARERLGQPVTDTREVEPRRGVGGERVLDRAVVAHRSRRRARHPPVLRVAERPGHEAHRRRVLRLDVRELGARPAGDGGGGGPDAARVHAPLRRLRDQPRTSAPLSRARRCPRPSSSDVDVERARAGLRRADQPAVAQHRAAWPTPEPDADGRRPVGVEVDGEVLRGFPTPSGRLEFYSSTLADWGWPEHALPGYIRSHVHPDDLEPTARCRSSRPSGCPSRSTPASANAKWLDEIAHTNPLWIHPTDAARLGVGTGDLVRVETEIGHFVRQGLGHRGHPARGRGLQPPHGPVEAGRASGQRAGDDGHRRPRPRRRAAGR